MVLSFFVFSSHLVSMFFILLWTSYRTLCIDEGALCFQVTLDYAPRFLPLICFPISLTTVHPVVPKPASPLLVGSWSCFISCLQAPAGPYCPKQLEYSSCYALVQDRDCLISYLDSYNGALLTVGQGRTEPSHLVICAFILHWVLNSYHG